MATLQVAAATDMEKLPPSFPQRSSNSVAVYGAGGEVAALQVVINGPCTVTDVRVPNDVGPVPATRCFIFREAFEKPSNGSGPLDSTNGGWTFSTPDGLIPRVDDVVGEQRSQFAPFAVPSRSIQAYWIDIHIPASAPAGTYGGQVIVSIQGQADTTVSFTLRIWGFNIPATSSLRNFWGTSYGGIAGGYGLSAGTTFSQIRSRLSQLALDHRMTLPVFDDGTNTQSNYDQYYAPLVNGSAPTLTQGAMLSTVFDDGAGWNGSLFGSKQSFYNYANANGWLSRLIDYTLDEPTANGTWGNAINLINAIHSINNKFKTLITCTINDANTNNVANILDIIVCIINFMWDKSGTYAGNQRANYNSWLAGTSNRELWLYQSCMSHGCDSNPVNNQTSYNANWATYQIDAPMMRNRMMQWLIHNFQATGELYYETMQTTDWVNGQWAFGGQGDGTLFLPGTISQIGGSTPIPCATLRTKAIRGGYSDYEYLKILDGMNDQFGAQLSLSMFPNGFTFPADFNTFINNRISIGNRIEANLGTTPQGSGGSSGSGGGFANVTVPVQVSGVPSGAILNSNLKQLTKIPHPKDPVVNRVQDQLIKTINPVVSAVSQMPTAQNGVFKTQPWVSVTLQNSWTSTGPEAAATYVDPSGDVKARGQIDVGRIGTTAFQVPAGQRPMQPQKRIVACGPNDSAIGLVVINPNGTVVPVSGTLPFELGGLSWKAEQ